VRVNTPLASSDVMARLRKRKRLCHYVIPAKAGIALAPAPAFAPAPALASACHPREGGDRSGSGICCWLRHLPWPVIQGAYAQRLCHCVIPANAGIAAQETLGFGRPFGSSKPFSHPALAGWIQQQIKR
ncbi:MAG: hypothetical protein RR326_14525, partial [Stenotrophomonas sp.]